MINLSIEEIENDENLLKICGIDKILPNRNYWFLRTQKGTYYEDFTNDGFVGIEWDKVSDLETIKKDDPENLKEDVIKNYPKIDKPGYVVSQILRFCNDMKKGDIILIPSENSNWINFGEILEDSAYIYVDDEDDFQAILDNTYSYKNSDEEIPKLKKRRKVKWLKTVKRKDLDPYLCSIIYSHIAIADINKYSPFIDRTLSKFYIKGEQAFFTYKINKKENIPYNDMLNLLNNNNDLIDYLNKKLCLHIDVNELVIKINVQSKGPVQLCGGVKLILILGLSISLLCGSKFDFEGLGIKTSIETEGLPKLIKTINDVTTNDKDKDLQTIKENFHKNNTKLQIELPKLQPN